ncbi:hypothetical protein JOE68_000520 [Saccharothrix algeriensis]|uniref:Uncharacterized protein n=1 Tax=Saccharothrix algeriensis TaxID=173560 RepID=A0ABS2S152_9PSEU|nr:hypothetical protein [Saccharothrix algeriensis]MBM7809655.1 hypothetical protein [Saccharothrix algeriensis]
MAQPLAVDGAMKWAERPLGRALSDFFTPSTSASRLMRTQRRALASSPCSSGMRQWSSTSTRSASGNRSSTSRPRGSSAAAGST